MATPKEQIAQHTYAEATQHQQVADDPLAPAPIRLRTGAMPRLRTLSRLHPREDGTRPLRPPARPAITGNRRSSRRPTPLTTRMLTISIQHRPAPHAAPCATSTRYHSSTGDRWCCPLPRNIRAASVSPKRYVLPESKDAADCCHSTW